MPRSCSVCTGLTSLELKTLNRDLRAGVPADVVARQYPELHPSSVRRHSWNHLDKPVVRDVRITETEYASDAIGSLADSMLAVRAARNAAVRRDQGHLVLSAARTEQQLTKFLLEDMGVTSVEVALFLRTSGEFARAVFRALRGRPDLAEAIAEQVSDPEMAEQVRQQAKSAPKEHAA